MIDRILNVCCRVKTLYRKPIESQGTAATDDDTYQQCAQIGPNSPHCLIGIDVADRTGGEKSDTKRRREQTDTHGENDHHRIVHVMDSIVRAIGNSKGASSTSAGTPSRTLPR